MKRKITHIIAIANNKGGIGKTTTTASVGTILARRGYKVLLVDMDAQANLTSSILPEIPDVTIYEALMGREALPVMSVPSFSTLHIVPSSLQLAKVDMELVSAMERERKLQRLIEPVASDYDFIMIDCPPSLGILTLNAFTACNGIIIPLVAEVLPFKGLTMVNDFIGMVSEHLNPSARVTGVLLTRWENTNLSKQIEQGLRTQLGELVFRTKIRKNVNLAEAPLEAKNIVEYAPRSNGAKDYEAFTNELLEKLNL